jgi:hypothetical protein
MCTLAEVFRGRTRGLDLTTAPVVRSRVATSLEMLAGRLEE